MKCSACDEYERAKQSSWCKHCLKDYADELKEKKLEEATFLTKLKRKRTIVPQPKGTGTLKRIFIW